MPLMLLTVEQGEKGPVVYMWSDGKEVGQAELDFRATANLIKNLSDKMVAPYAKI